MQLHNLLIGGFDQVNYQHYCDEDNHCLTSKKNCKGCDGHCCYNDNNNNSGGEVQGNHVTAVMKAIIIKFSFFK